METETTPESDIGPLAIAICGQLGSFVNDVGQCGPYLAPYGSISPVHIMEKKVRFVQLKSDVGVYINVPVSVFNAARDSVCGAPQGSIQLPKTRSSKPIQQLGGRRLNQRFS
mgnify:CR=1 FL=1